MLMQILKQKYFVNLKYFPFLFCTKNPCKFSEVLTEKFRFVNFDVYNVQMKVFISDLESFP